MHISNTLYTSTGMPTPPNPVTISYTRTKTLITLCVNITTDPAPPSSSPSESPSTPTYSCDIISLSSSFKPPVSDIFRVLADADFLSTLTPSFLSSLSLYYPDTPTDYETLVAVLVSTRYTYADELACHRKALLGDPADLAALNVHVELCKNIARTLFPCSAE